MFYHFPFVDDWGPFARGPGDIPKEGSEMPRALQNQQARPLVPQYIIYFCSVGITLYEILFPYVLPY